MRWMDFGAFRVRVGDCPMCGLTLIAKLRGADIGVRCVRCGASAITMSLLRVLAHEVPDFRQRHVYELSARGPLFEYLRCSVSTLTSSEYFDDVHPGEYKGSVQCQDVQQLTFHDASFDICTSTEVFEHVLDDFRGFSEVRRILRPDGVFIFTVPLSGGDHTVERTRLVDGKLCHLLPPEYHGDRVRGEGRVLVFRDYGLDIVDRLVICGFSAAWIDDRCRRDYFGHGRPVVVARA